MTTTITCEHCERDIDVATDPHCVQSMGQDVICEACRERAYDRWQESLMAGEGPVSLAEQQLAAWKIKRGIR